jgi:cell division protein FtsQ
MSDYAGPESWDLSLAADKAPGESPDKQAEADAQYRTSRFTGQSPKSAPKKAYQSVLGKRFLTLLLILGGAEMIWLFAVNPCLPFSSVELAGIENMEAWERREVFAAAGISAKSSWMTVNVRKAETALKELFFIEAASVRKHFPGSLRIELSERRAVAMALINREGRTEPVFFDRDGLLFRIGYDYRTSQARVLPILSGLVISDPAPGMELPRIFVSLLRDIETIGKNSPELLEAISEIRIQTRPYDGFELLLYPAHHSVRIRTGGELQENMLRYMMLAIDVIVNGGIMIDEIDFRSGTASYTIKEASSG